MPASFETWFPLAVYYADLDVSPDKTLEMLRWVDEKYQSSKQRTSDNSAWTGDIHDVSRLHLEPSFDWITGEVASHARGYLGLLGHNLDIIDIYVQRSWPVVSLKDQTVFRHTHNNSHLSAVYYLYVPEDIERGSLRFINRHAPNEISKGIGGETTKGYSQENILNFHSANYAPVQNRLIFFPAKQPHEVEAHNSGSARISLSFDLIITSKEENSGEHEFLMPPPTQWRKI